MAAPRRGWMTAGLLVTMAAGGAGVASAQTLGTFRWQLQPFCNVVSLTLATTPAGFTLTGTEDQCGAADKASAVGVASFGASGNVALNFTIVTAPAGKPVHVSAVVSPATGSGTWTDSTGNTGAFAFFGATPGLPPRPVSSSGLGANSITAVQIADGAVGAAELGGDAVTGANVVDGSLSAFDLADAPRAAFVELPSFVPLPSVGTPTNVRQITFTAPSAGRVIVNASATVITNSDGVDSVECSLTTGTVVDPNARRFAGDLAGLTAGLYLPMGLTRGFNVPPGSFTARLICRNVFGAISIQDTAMTAMYFPG